MPFLVPAKIKSLFAAREYACRVSVVLENAVGDQVTPLSVEREIP